MSLPHQQKLSCLCNALYDRWPARSYEDALLLSGRCWSFEETPFVLPPPWRNATSNDLEEGCLLLRDPSNARRLPFWRTVFRIQDIAVLHLVRDPRESVQGLCDGWNYPFGFQTIPSENALVIRGYNDSADLGENRWKHHRLNFCIDKTLSRALIDEHRTMSLVQVCAHQWRDAHARIIRDAEHLSLQRSIVYFADLRGQPGKTFQEVCDIVSLEQSSSGRAYARSFPNNRVMATSIVGSASHERWQVSPFATEIVSLGLSGFFDEVSRKLGLVQLAFGRAKARSGNKLNGDKRPTPSIHDLGESSMPARSVNA